MPPARVLSALLLFIFYFALDISLQIDAFYPFFSGLSTFIMNAYQSG